MSALPVNLAAGLWCAACVCSAVVCPGRLGERNFPAFSEIPENSRRQVGGMCNNESAGGDDVCCRASLVDLYDSVLRHCWLGSRKSIRPVKIEWWGVGVVICLERGADCLHMVQLMPLTSQTPSSLVSFKSRLVLPFWYWLTQVVLEKRPLNGCSSSSLVLFSDYVWKVFGIRLCL